MDLRFYNFNFEILHIEPHYISSNWTVYYNNIGQWEGHISLNSKAVPLIMSEKYLVVVQGNNAAIITGKRAAADFAIYGRTCNWLLTRRVTPAFEEDKGDVETLSRKYVSEAFSEFTLGDITGFGKEISFGRNTYNPTFEVVRDCLNNDSAGHRVKFDYTKKLWVYDVLKGENITNRLLISEANKNAFDTEVTDDCLDYFNCGWYEQKGEDESLWVYVSGSEEGIYRWETTLSGSGLSEAETDLGSKKRNSFIKVKSDTLKLGADYNLGDIVRVQVVKGQYAATKEKRITGANLWYEGSNIGQQPIFEEDV